LEVLSLINLRLLLRVATLASYRSLTRPGADASRFLGGSSPQGGKILILEFELVTRIIILAKSMILAFFGDDSQTRAFLYVSDWVEATKRMLFTPGLKGEVFNVGSDK
jgi:hypothetical protein